MLRWTNTAVVKQSLHNLLSGYIKKKKKNINVDDCSIK